MPPTDRLPLGVFGLNPPQTVYSGATRSEKSRALRLRPASPMSCSDATLLSRISLGFSHALSPAARLTVFSVSAKRRTASSSQSMHRADHRRYRPAGPLHRFRTLADRHLEVLAGDIGESNLDSTHTPGIASPRTVDLIVHPAALVNKVWCPTNNCPAPTSV